MNNKKNTSLEETLIKHGDLAKKIVAEDHLDFDALYALAFGEPSPEVRLHAEAHFETCEDCRMQLDELRNAADFIEQYEPDLESEEELPDRVRQNIPQVKKATGSLIRLGFDKNKILSHIEGVVKSMGGIIDDLSDLVIEALSPDIEFLEATRGSAQEGKDYRVEYEDYRIFVSTVPGQNLLEINLQWQDKNKEVRTLRLYLTDTDDHIYLPDSTAVLGDRVKAIFSALELNDKAYELHFGSEPISE
jgi:hypothetical protein